MTKRVTLISILLFFMLKVWCPFGQDMEPQEPDIILPMVVMEIEDLSVEDITAELPESPELLTPERGYPLPEAGDLEVEETPFDISVPEEGVSAAYITRRKDLIAEAVLGTGNLNHFFGNVSLFKFGEPPEGKIFFEHEMLDGFSSKPPGSGYNIREDSLEGMVRFNLSELNFQIDGEFHDLERGLQGNGDFYSKINRFVTGDAEVKYELSDQFTIKGALNTSVASQLITESGNQASVPEGTTEFILSPTVTGELQLERVYLGFSPRLSYRSVSGNPDLSLTRIQAAGKVGIDLSDIFRVDGNISWYWSDNTDHLFPFHLALSVTPSDSFTIQAKAGYRLIEYNLIGVFNDYYLADAPDTLEDNHGWFFDLGSRWILSDYWILNAEVSLMDNSGMLTPGEQIDGTTGLFPLYQEESVTLSTDIGARWNILKGLSLRFGLSSELLDRPRFFPQYRFSIELDALEQSGKYGGGLTSIFLTGEHEYIQAPLIEVNGFYRIADSIRLSLEIKDLLAPVLDRPRYSWYPYIEKGFSITLKTYINF